ncbi:uncharacterized protein LOC136040949 isoform X3 [Artemia franciscana]|uniref:Uncharacterized protein n=1 Tax=Artemia franciscana TaxID=6661 RepID=A0AA88HRH4_ARTSF|nr:hypothetical protein QYM36_009687 [Artemia franciscana]
MDEETVVKNINVSLVVEEDGILMRNLGENYYQLFSIRIPYKELGYSSIRSLVLAHPKSFRIVQRPGGEKVIASADESTAHIVSLVKSQKKSKPKPARRTVPKSLEAIKDEETVVKNINVSLVVEEDGILIRKLEENYHQLFSTHIPYKELGYSNISSLLRAHPKSFRIVQRPEGEKVIASADESTAHIVSLVKGQKKSKPKPARRTAPKNMSEHHGHWDLACKVYIGNLSSEVDRYMVEDLFSSVWPLRNVWVARNPPGFGFIEFEDPKDAEESCRHFDGLNLRGSIIKVEMSNGKTRIDRRDNYCRDSYRENGYSRNSYREGHRATRRQRPRTPVMRYEENYSRSLGREAIVAPYERNCYRSRTPVTRYEENFSRSHGREAIVAPYERNRYRSRTPVMRFEENCSRSLGREAIVAPYERNHYRSRTPIMRYEENYSLSHGREANVAPYERNCYRSRTPVIRDEEIYSRSRKREANVPAYERNRYRRRSQSLYLG